MDSPYEISRGPDELHYTYLDTFGRPVIVAHKENLVEQHIQDIVVGAHAAPESGRGTRARRAPCNPTEGGRGRGAHADPRERPRAGHTQRPPGAVAGMCTPVPGSSRGHAHAGPPAAVAGTRTPAPESSRGLGRPLPRALRPGAPPSATLPLLRCTTPSTRCSCCRSRCWWWPPSTSSSSPSSSTSG